MTTLAELAPRVLRKLGVNILSQSDLPSLTKTLTSAELATQVLQKLGVVAAGEAAQADDLALAQSKIDQVHGLLVRSNLISWATSACPIGYASPVVLMATVLTGPEFGVPVADGTWERAKAEVRMISMGGAAAEALALEKLQSVHSSLGARERTRWIAADIPDYAQEPIITMAAYLLAPEFELQMSPAAWVAAEGEIWRAIEVSSAGDTIKAVYF